MGDYLVVGVHSDREILKNKGPTLCNDEERYAAVAACKWVDKVVQDAPYLTSLKWLDQYDCDFCVHGDDVTTMSDGTDCYSIVKAAGRYKECKRTEGVSTTDLLSRILDRKYLKETRDKDDSPQTTPAEVKDALYTQRMLDSFSADLLHRKPSEDSRVVYVCGSWDLFRMLLIFIIFSSLTSLSFACTDSGHSDFFKQAKTHGSHLIVGIYSDATIHSQTSLYPIQEMRERALSVLSCRHVDGFVLDCPLLPDMAFMAKHNISAFCHGEMEMKVGYDEQVEECNG